MKMNTEFFMHMLPPTMTHQMKKVRVVKNKPIFYEPSELKAVRKKLQGHLSSHIPKEKYTTAIRVIVKWCFPINGDQTDGQYKTTKPDLDNMNKLFADVCTDLGFWEDDSLISSLVIEKFYANIPGIYVYIESLD